MSAQGLPGRRLPTIEIDYSLVYEFLMTLIVFNDDKCDDYEIGSDWFDTVRTKAGPDLLKDMELFDSDSNHFWKHLLGLAYESKPPRDVPTFIANIEAT